MNKMAVTCLSELFQSFINLFKYKEPKNQELGFELIEGQNEGIEEQKVGNTTTNNNTKNHTIREDKNKSINTPLTVEEWNKLRKAENETVYQPQNNTDSISGELCVNLETIKKKFLLPKNDGLIIREFNIGKRTNAFMAYINGMVDKQTLNLAIIPQLMSKDAMVDIGEQCPVDFLIKNVLAVHNLKIFSKYSDIVMQILRGSSALFIEHCNECIVIDTIGYEKRSVSKPITESVVRGSQEGFTENLLTNITLLRRIVKNENLVNEMIPVGRTNHSSCAVIYIDGIANSKVINEVKKRIKRINTDAIMGDGMIEQFIEDNSFMLFPQVLNTERPDRAASFIMEGQVVIIAEGTPFALVVPVTFFRLFHTSEDSQLRWPYGTFLRFIRILGLIFATVFPALYVAIALFHSEAIPTQILEAIILSKERVPFPTLVEILLLEISFELIHEAGIRVPTVIGPTIGIVGALILGQAAVAAGIVSPILVIIIAVTGLGSFVIPNYTMGIALRILKLLFILIAAMLGFYGITVLIFIVAIFACSMKSFGVPYFSPVAPRTKINPDFFIRAPIWMQKNRPDEFNTHNRKKQGKNQEVWINEEQDRKGDDGKS
jgi:spore germination protein KA